MAAKKKQTKKEEKLDKFYIKLLLVAVVGFVAIAGVNFYNTRNYNQQLKDANKTQGRLIENLKEEAKKLMEEVVELSFSPKNLLKLTNLEREKEGLRTLTLNPLLNESSKLKAEDIQEKAYWAHDSPEGVEPWHFFDITGYSYSHAGENLARGYKKGSEVIQAWMVSTDHRENMLDRRHKEVGFYSINLKDIDFQDYFSNGGKLTVAHYAVR
jgi:uncharacterized protein YkwD